MTAIATVQKDGKKMLDLDAAKAEQRFVEAWGQGQLDKLTKSEQSMFLMAFGTKIGLRAELGELMIYMGRPYITRSGMIRIAHQSGLLAGMVPRPATSMEARNYGTVDGDVLWVCDVFRHGAIRAFRGWGCVNVTKDKNPVAKQYPRELAKKRALYDGLRMAFPPDESLGPIHQRYLEEAEEEAMRQHRLPMASADDGEGAEDVSEFAAGEDDTTEGTPEAEPTLVEPPRKGEEPAAA
jgi:hypothetical protein